MSNARPVVQDSIELARRINDSTDIVTDLTDVVQNELPQKALQGDNPEATNSEILRAIDNIDIDTSELAKEETLVQGVSGIRSDIANIPAPDLSTVAKEETLSSGIQEILQELAPKATKAQLEAATAAIINAIPTDYAKQGANAAATNSAILETSSNIEEKIGEVSTKLEDVAKEEKLETIDTKLDTLNGYFDDVTYENVIEELNSSENDA